MSRNQNEDVVKPGQPPSIDPIAGDFLDAQGIGAAVLDARCHIVWINDAFAELVGRQAESILDLVLTDVADSSDPKQLEKIRRLRPGRRLCFDTNIQAEKGQSRWFNVDVRARIDPEEADSKRYYVAVLDVTERKQSERQLSQSHSRYQQLVDNALMGIYRSTPNGRFVRVNPALVRILGYDSADEVLALRLPDDLYAAPGQRAMLQKKHEPHGVLDGKVVVWKRKDGSEVFVRIYGLAVRDELGDVLYYEGIVQDVSKERLTEQELLQERELAESLSESLPGISIVYDLKGRRLRWNKNVENVTGYTNSELAALPPFALIAPADRVELGRQMKETIVRGSITFEAGLLTKDGRTIPYFFTGHRTHFEGKPAVIGLGLDISHRKEAEEKLRESEANLRAIFSNSLQAFVLMDTERRIIAANPRANAWARQILGAPLKIGVVADHLFHMFDVDIFRQAFDEALRGVTTVRQHMITVASREAWFETSYNPVVTDTGDVVGVSMSVLNVTEQKAAEEALRRSETRYRSIVEDQLDMIMRANSDGTLTYVNEAYARFTGSTPDEMIGKNFISLMGEENQKRMQQKLDRLSPDNPIEIDEHSEVGADGRKVWFRWVDRGIFDKQGHLIEVQGIGSDITQRREIEDELRRSETRLQHVIDTVPEGVLLLDASYTVVLANPVAQRILSVLSPDWEDGPLTYLGTHPLKHLLTSPPVGHWHDIALPKRVFEVIARPVENGPRNRGWVLVLRDVTQERERQRQVQRQERLAAVGHLAAGIAHDFNNILSVITLYAQLVLKTVQMPTHAQERIATIEKQAMLAVDLIHQILDFSRQSVLTQQPIPLLPVISEMVHLLERTLPENITIHLEHSNEPFLTLADSSRIQQAIMNLAVNARDAMPDGGLISIALSRLSLDVRDAPPVLGMPKGVWVKIEVTDSGSGIPQAELSHIFEPFFTTKKVGHGTGLGLAQVYGIVQQHSGYIDVATELGQGTTFSIYLPALLTEEEAPYESKMAQICRGSGQTILLVEDDAAAREALVESLTWLNYTVVEAENGRQALAYLDDNAPKIHLVISDVVMPEMGGVALFYALQQKKLDIPIFLLTGHPLSQDLENLQAQGLAGWLPKPPQLESLSQQVDRILKQHN